MKHRWQGVWLTEDLEGYRCINCKVEVLEPEYYSDDECCANIDYYSYFEDVE